MNFIHIPTHEALRPFIRDYWHLRCMSIGDSCMRMISNGAISLQFYRAQPIRVDNDSTPRTAVLLVSDMGYIDLHAGVGPLEVIGVEFTPFGARMFFNASMADCAGRHLSPSEMGDQELKDLSDRLMETIDNNECYRLLNEFFLHRLIRSVAEGVNAKRMQSVVSLAENTRISMENVLSTKLLASEACLSPKQFTRIFHEYVGMQPKSYLRILRYHAAMVALQGKAQDDGKRNMTLTEIAWNCGYYDLSHMTADFLQISGDTPAAALSAMSNRPLRPTITHAFEPTINQVLKKIIRIENLA